jgi:Short C-terminal domain
MATSTGSAQSPMHAGPEQPPRGRAPAINADRRSISHPRLLLVDVLLVLTTALAVVATFAVWANRQLLNPDNWSAASTQLLQNPAVRDATANYAVDQLYANVDVAGLIKSGLPKQFQSLAGPASGALRNAAVQGATLALSDPRVQSLWANANRAAAQAFVVIVNGGKGALKINRGVVTLDLAPIVDDIAARLGLSAKIGSKLPSSIANLHVLKSDQLKLVQGVGRAVKGLALALTIIVPLLYALAIGLARGHRRRTVMSVGFAILIAGVLVLLARETLKSQVPASLVKTASIRPAASAVVSIGTSMLSEIAAEFVIVGAVVIGAAWLAGPARAALVTRRAVAPFLRDHPVPTYGIVVTVMALIFIWQPIRATGTLAGVIVFMLLALLATTALRRQAVTEFPDARAGDTIAAIRARVRQLRESRPSHRTPRANAPASVSEELERLAALRDRGAITTDEYHAAKVKLLNNEPTRGRPT